MLNIKQRAVKWMLYAMGLHLFAWIVVSCAVAGVFGDQDLEVGLLYTNIDFPLFALCMSGAIPDRIVYYVWEYPGGLRPLWGLAVAGTLFWGAVAGVCAVVYGGLDLGVQRWAVRTGCPSCGADDMDVVGEPCGRCGYRYRGMLWHAWVRWWAGRGVVGRCLMALRPHLRAGARCAVILMVVHAVLWIGVTSWTMGAALERRITAFVLLEYPVMAATRALGLSAEGLVHACAEARGGVAFGALMCGTLGYGVLGILGGTLARLVMPWRAGRRTTQNVA